MEDVLAVYTRPRDPDRPLVCLDESSKQLIAETRLPIPMKPGRPARCDYEYARNGTANLFMMFAPLEGWRHVKVTDRHTAVDYAHVLKELADIHFANAKVIVLVQDNLNIHSKASLYEARSVPSRRSPPPGRTLRMALHTKTWQLARSRRVRTRRSIFPVPRSPHTGQANPHRRDRCLGARPKCKPHHRRLALHNHQRPHQAQASLPVNLIESGD
jgi:DDE superfamily endonuclease